ncbi:MAG TPA: AAA family ATPase [Streptosporangiaceae bacterium]|nr:AAA family ATPase [Streptosporangiaceae bacterium]
MSVITGMLEDVSTTSVSPVLVGRDEQLALLDDALATARRGEPATVLIGGEAGVGKSRLVSEFADRAAAGGRVLAGGCLELGAAGLAFAPFTAVLRQVVRDLGVAGVQDLLTGQASRELARLLPELGESARHEDEAYQGEARARLFEQVLALFERLADAGSLTLIIEDAHWADHSTRDLLTFLIGNQRVLRGVLIVVTFRSDELHRTHPLRALLAELGRVAWVERFELPRLTRAEAAGQIAAILGRDPAPALVDGVFRRSEGNPLFVEQLLGCDGGELPESLRDLVLANVQRLPEETSELLRLASAGGVRLGHGLLARVSGIADDDLTRVLRPAVAGNVLLADADGYLFRHALIREAMHDDLLPGEHSRLHARYAQAISDDPSLVPPGRAAIELALHWYSAHDMTWALVSAWEAAAVASRALAHSEQLAMLSRVLELWDRVPDAAQRIGTDHVGVLERAVQVTHFTGDEERGYAFATAALDELDDAAEPARVALLLERRGMLRCYADPGAGQADLRRALGLVGDGRHERERGRVLASLGHLQHKERNDSESLAAAQEALGIARQTGDLSTQASALITVAMLSPRSGPGGEDAALDMLVQARQVAGLAHDYDHLTVAVINESHLLEGAGRHERAAEVARNGLAEAQRYGLSRTSGAILAINLAEPLASLGRWDEAAEVITAALAISSVDPNRASLWQLAGTMAVARGDLAGAREAAEQGARLLARLTYRDQTFLPLARLQIESATADGRLGDALAAASRALDSYDLQATPRYAWPVLIAAVRAAAELAALPAAARAEGDAEAADAVLRGARAAADKLDVLSPVQAADQLTFRAESARADYAGTILAGADADADADAEPAADAGDPGPWLAAAAAWDELRQPYPVAAALLRAAEAALAGRGDRAVAEQALRRAAGIAGGLGAAPLLADVTLLARRARISLDGPAPGEAPAVAAPASPPGPGVSAAGRLGLTPREFEVLRLVAAGLSNAAIAGQLFISAKTVSVHVSNILAKLGTATRGEASALAHRLRLFDDYPAA